MQKSCEGKRGKQQLSKCPWRRGRTEFMWGSSVSTFPTFQALTLHFVLSLLLVNSIILREEAPNCSYLMLGLQHYRNIFYRKMQPLQQINFFPFNNAVEDFWPKSRGFLEPLWESFEGCFFLCGHCVDFVYVVGIRSIANYERRPL